jgi:hypothetical protein
VLQHIRVVRLHDIYTLLALLEQLAASMAAEQVCTADPSVTEGTRGVMAQQALCVLDTIAGWATLPCTQNANLNSRLSQQAC